MTIDVLEDLDTVVTLDEEIVEHVCPLHEDLSFDDFAELNVHQQAWLDLACADVAFHEDGARGWQLKLEREDLSYKDRAFAKGQMSNALRGAQRIRDAIRRTIAGEPEPDVPFIDLYAR